MFTRTSPVRIAGAALAGALLATGTGTAALASPAPAHRQVARHIPYTAATVAQNADGTVTLTWNAPGVRHVTVFAGTAQDRISHERPVATASGKATVTVRNLGTADRWWFELVPDRGRPLTLADRSLHLASAPNFRDAGGYRTSDGRWVRMGVLYRSGDLGKLTDADVAKLKRLGVRTVYDLRTPAEQAASPDRLPAGARSVTANVSGTAGTDVSITSPEAAARMMVDGEKAMVSSASGRAAYGSLLAAAADPRSANLVYHCTAGKDRTGWASAAILTALGVPRATVRQDYLASNTYRAAENAAVLAQLPPAQAAIYKPLLEVRPEYLDAGFDEVAARYGSFDRYLREGLGVSGAALRRQLLIG
ncbi:tyrosine-protein phosphatase [Actinomadura parmotrematis]|uniref:Tyrosine-protein phosphatase n=1 Tax=Actinomadura parmotrematis TaxID=2864039 RepID=A0ABS7G4W1_9ACTN|nr:tyrosine-protein phosphatase [Actinomadura parmotrematis]MBW8486837.1 tyrosine-protein phosphatase [Actinomadura parmotrematis]